MILRLLFFLICVWIFIYTISYGIWELKQKNKLGAAFVFLLGIDELVMSIYTLLVY